MDFRAIWDYLTNVPAIDRADARDRALLHVVLLGSTAIALAVLTCTYTDYINGWVWVDWHDVTYGLSIGLLVICTAVYLIDRYGPRGLGRALFPLFLPGLLVASEVLEEVVNGRSTFGFLVPICIAPLVCQPWAGLPVAGVSGLLLIATGLGIGERVNPYAPLVFLAAALLLWPLAHRLKRALLYECRASNQEKHSPTSSQERHNLITDLKKLLHVPAADPDNARRRKLVNLLLIITAGAIFAVAVATSICQIVGLEYQEGSPICADWTAFDIAIVLVTLILVNRTQHGWLASILMLLCMVSYIAGSDAIEEIADGRTTLTFAVPIVLASFVLPPYASFVVAGLSIAIVSAYSVELGWAPNPYQILALLSFAILSWLAARSLEQAVQEARSEASHKQAILEGIADGVVVFGNERRITAANPAMAALAGLPEANLVGQDIESLIHTRDTDLDGVEGNVIREMLVSRHPIRFEWNGKTLSATLSSVLDPSGQRTGTVAVLRDITREVEVERARESLFAVTAHELRTPLNAIINFANMMRKGMLSHQQQLDASRRIAANGERLLLLVNNLLERAKLEAGKVELNIKSFSMAEMIHTVCHTMSVVAQEKGLTLTCRIEEDMPHTLQGDEQRLYQVLVNLISNAIKFTESGSVTVHAYLPDPEHWALEVTDTGVGIPAEAHARIFEPFELAQDPSTRKQAGAGLGLSIVKHIVKLMKGEISLKSQVGQGSTFIITLPLTLDGPG